MSSDFRQFLDIKRELEYKITELKNHSDTNQSEKVILELRREIIELKEKLAEKEKAAEQALNENKILRSENENLKEAIEALKEQKPAEKEEPEQNEKKTIWTSFFHYFSD